MKFSVITPAYCYDEKRKNALLRCINSVKNQTIDQSKYEHIVVDQTEDENCRIPKYDQSFVRYLRQKHIERLYALRKGFQESSGDWICLLDSDDMYLPHYLEEVEKMTRENEDQKLFNFGNIYVHSDGRVTTRDEFKPEKKKIGHEVFGGGNIVNGTFVFHRSVWKELGDWPTTTDKLWNPWDFSIAFQDEFPELKTMFVVDHPDHPEGIAKELGNPWGNDYSLFYRYTRKYHSLPVKKHLLVVYAK